MDAAREQHKINAEREMRQILEAREKEAHHLASIKKAAHDEGHESGLAEGLAKGEAKGLERVLLKGKKETAIKMFQLGIDSDMIAKATGLSKDEVRQLIESHT